MSSWRLETSKCGPSDGPSSNLFRMAYIHRDITNSHGSISGCIKAVTGPFCDIREKCSDWPITVINIFYIPRLPSLGSQNSIETSNCAWNVSTKCAKSETVSDNRALSPPFVGINTQ